VLVRVVATWEERLERGQIKSLDICVDPMVETRLAALSIGVG
jgi:hypothetical protein